MPPLSDLQLRTLTAAIDRIVPADDFPSASGAGCLDFLLRLISLEKLEEFYRSGLDGLEAEARKRGASFSELSEADQDSILARLEKVRRSVHWRISPKAFIELLARQTIEGYYSDPGNGGNRNGVGWQLVGFVVKG